MIQAAITDVIRPTVAADNPNTFLGQRIRQALQILHLCALYVFKFHRLEFGFERVHSSTLRFDAFKGILIGV
jgi:hypothetical protein